MTMIDVPAESELAESIMAAVTEARAHGASDDQIMNALADAIKWLFEDSRPACERDSGASGLSSSTQRGWPLAPVGVRIDRTAGRHIRTLRPFLAR